MEFILKYLTEHLPLIAGVIKIIAADEKKVYDILSTGIIIKANKSDVIYTNNEPVHELYILLSGSVNIKFDNEDNITTITKDQIVDITEILEKNKTTVYYI